MTNRLRQLPPVNSILESPILLESAQDIPRDLIIESIRLELDQARQSLKDNGEALPGAEEIARRTSARLAGQIRPKLRRVINATGIVLHTNLGRAPIAEEAAQAAFEAARGYLNLELDLETGKRSSRQIAIRDWLCRLTGAESATAVNNNAAATVIVLRALAAGQGSHRLARPAHRDRRQFPHPRHHGRQRGRCCAKSAPRTSRAWPITKRPSARTPPP